MDTDLWVTWERGQALQKPYLGAPIVTSVGESVGFNSASMGQATQTTIPQFFTKGTSISLGSSQPELRPSILTMGISERQPAWPPPPELLKTYESEMKKMRGKFVVNEGTKITESSKRSFGEASQPTSSSTMISGAQAAKIRAQVHQR